MIKLSLQTVELMFGLNPVENFLRKNALILMVILLALISFFSSFIFFENGLGLAYNDARSHLNIGRRVVEGLKPGIAQLGSVWLPLSHVLMIPTIWNDFMWHSGLSGALVSMASFVGTGILIYKFLEKLSVGLIGRLFGVLVFVANVNILYLQSTAMTELLLIFTMTAAIYELVLWHKEDKVTSLIKSAFWMMMASLIRYDGWFLLIFSSALIVLRAYKKWGYRTAEGILLFFLTLGALGIGLWFIWNLLIFGDPLYFAFGPYSAHSQQVQLEEAGVLATKGNLPLSLKVYLYALIYNIGAFTTILGILGMIAFWMNKQIKNAVKLASTVLLAPFLFNVIALYLGHSVLFIQGISGNTWFNVRYGVMMLPSIAIFVGYLVHKLVPLRLTIIGLFLFVTFFAFANVDAVTIDDARVGSSQKNVAEVSGWLAKNAKDEKGFVLISAASHDAIIFSSGLPMKRYIHEGTGAYWENATTSPDRWARWIVMRTNDLNDSTFKLTQQSGQLEKYELVNSYPFADIYQLKSEYLETVNTEPTLGKQK